jgi:hypothetical protein
MPTRDGDWPFVNVLADGPSILQAQSFELLDGPTVAINCAIRMEPFLPIDVWAAVDAPGLLWDAVNQHFKEHMDVLTTGNNLLAWDALGLPMERILAVEPIYLEKDGVQVEDERGRKVLMPTMIFTLAYLVKYRNARAVRVFGADMAGQNGPLHPFLDFNPVNDWCHDQRWAAERVAFAEATRLFRKEGRILQRMKR